VEKESEVKDGFSVSGLVCSLVAVLALLSVWGGVGWADPVVAVFSAVTRANTLSGANFGIPIGTPIRGTVMFDPDLVQQVQPLGQSFPGSSGVGFHYFDQFGALHAGGQVAINVAGQTFNLPISSISLYNWETGSSGAEIGTYAQDQLQIQFGTQFLPTGLGLCGAFNGEAMTRCLGVVQLWYPNSTLGNSLPETLDLPLLPVPHTEGTNTATHFSFVDMVWSSFNQTDGVTGWLDGNDEDTSNTSPVFDGVSSDDPIIPIDCVGNLCTPPWNLPPVVVPRFPSPPAECLTNVGGGISRITCPPSPPWIPMDPPMAVGYDYQLSPDSPKVVAFELPMLGDNTYRLHLFDGSPDVIVQGGVEYFIADGGVDHFQILDIEESAGVDSEDPRAFVTLLAFGSTGAVSLTMTPLTSESTAFNFTGFFSPVDNPPVLNSAKAGSAIPVKFSLGGNQGLNIFAQDYPRSTQIPCDSTAPIDGVEQTVTAGSSSLTYDATADQYTYVWKTDKAWTKTCRQLAIQLTDGSVHRANFSFK
jgi:hypothetical protein